MNTAFRSVAACAFALSIFLSSPSPSIAQESFGELCEILRDPGDRSVDPSAAHHRTPGNFLAYPTAFRGSVFVAAGDVDADGRADIVTGPGAGGGPLVKAFHGVSGAEIRSFFAGDPSVRGRVRVASADVNPDGHAEIIVAAGPGAPPLVKIFHGATSAELRSFLVYPREVTVGVFVAAPVRALAAFRIASLNKQGRKTMSSKRFVLTALVPVAMFAAAASMGTLQAQGGQPPAKPPGQQQQQPPKQPTPTQKQQQQQQQQAQQQQQQQQAQQQQQMAQMQQMMQRMDHISTRAQQMSQAMTKQMDRLQTRDRDQARLLLQLCDNVQSQARETRGTMDRIHLMLQDKTISQDRDMLRDMDRLRDRLHAVTEGLEDMVQTMERMQGRLQARGGQTR